MFERLTEAEASSYIIVLGPQCRNCSVVASVTNALCYIRQLSAPRHACCPSKLSCSSSRTARAAGRSSQGGRPATTEGGWAEGENFHFSQSECGQPAPGPKEREGKMQAAVGKLLEQVACACAPVCAQLRF